MFLLIKLAVSIEIRLLCGLWRFKVVPHAYAFIMTTDVIIVIGDFQSDRTSHVGEAV